MGASTTPKVWGKRTHDAGGSTSTLFRDLSTEQKLKRRREERMEKKERERTLSYFLNTQKVLLQQSSENKKAKDGLLSVSVDGFFQELVVLLKADASSSSSSSSSPFHLLRNGVICQTIEIALKNASLLHCKSLLFLFLGHVMPLITSPVASYVWETLIASLEQGLSVLVQEKDSSTPFAPSSAALVAGGEFAENHSLNGGASDGFLISDFEKEMQDGGQGIHAGSGIPSTATLLSHAVEEVIENMETIISHPIGARTIRSMVLALGGYSARNFPLPHPRVRFPALLGSLATTTVQIVEEYYSREYCTTDLSETWLAALQVPSTSYLIQSLLRVSEEGSTVDQVCRVHLENIYYGEYPLFQELLQDAAMGWHVFESYSKVPTPLAVCEEGDKAALTWPLTVFTNNGSQHHTTHHCRTLESASPINEKGKEKEKKGKKKKGTQKSGSADLKSEGAVTRRPSSSANGSEMPSVGEGNGLNVEDKTQVGTLEGKPLGEQTTEEDEAYKKQKRSFLSSSAWGRSLKIMRRVWKGSSTGDAPNDPTSSPLHKPDVLTSSPNINLPSCFSGEGGLQRARFLLQDLALFSPSSTHLYLLWECIFLPRLKLFWRHPELLGAMTAVARKAALGERGALPMWISSRTHHPNDGRSSHPLHTETSFTTRSKEEEEAARVQKEEAQGVRFFTVPLQIQKNICDAICKSFAALKKGTTIAEFLLFHDHCRQNDDETRSDNAEQRDQRYAGFRKVNETASYQSSNAGADLIRYLMCFHPQASLMIQHSIEKLRVNDLQLAALCARKGSLVLQQYLRASALASSPHLSTSSSVESPQRAKTAMTVPVTINSILHDKAPTARFFRRISPFLLSWAKNKYGGYVIEELFDVASLSLKEIIVQGLTPLYQELSQRHKKTAQIPYGTANHGNENGDEEDTDNLIIAKKILQKCSVEQYIYRPEEWKKSAQQQCQAQNLLNKMALFSS